VNSITARVTRGAAESPRADVGLVEGTGARNRPAAGADRGVRRDRSNGTPRSEHLTGVTMTTGSTVESRMPMNNRLLGPAQSVYLDLLRAGAALLVLFGHAAKFFLDGTPYEHNGMEVAGVPLFFLVSGFLITYSVIQKQGDPHYGFREYAIDRFCRIYVAFVPALFFVWLLDALSLRLPFDVGAQRLEELTYLR